jgi:hypothetical protein
MGAHGLMEDPSGEEERLRNQRGKAVLDLLDLQTQAGVRRALIGLGVSVAGRSFSHLTSLP